MADIDLAPLADDTRDPADRVVVVREGTPGTETLKRIPIAEFIEGPARWYAFDDMQGATSDATWTVTNSGTGAGQSAVANKPDTGPGWNNFNLGTTTTGRTARYTSLTGIDLGDGLATYGMRLQVGALSDGTNTYTSRFGFIDNVTAESTDGVFFRYTHSVNGGRWQAVTRSNNSETMADTGVAVVTATTVTLRIEVDASEPEARFYIDGTLVATITTTIPPGKPRVAGAGTMGIKSAGTTATTYAVVDYQFAEQFVAGRT